VFGIFGHRPCSPVQSERAHNETDRSKAVAHTIGLSLDLLDQARQARFGELGIFPEDADVPVDIVARFWAETGGLDAGETEDFLNKLSDLSLLLHLDLDRRTLRLHDIIRHFLLDQAGKERLVAEHKCVGCENRHRARPPQRALGFGLRAVPAAGRAARLARLSSCHTAGSCCRLRVLDGRLVVGDANGHLHWLEIIT
jgi:hypothetical protein